jgi:prepilin-type N-terminal cleavage/methylation domain-containing protein/prepilin-type processing-associated H-X9-DG protein
MPHTDPARRRRAAFTLVELLVVIGIIALLISILLPSLNKARKSAGNVQCMSNMRQVAMAMIGYANANHGTLIPIRITGSTAYPNGFFWANELVREHYITAPNSYISSTRANYSQGSAFRCPEASDIGINPGNINTPSYEPAFPADKKNSAGFIDNLETDPATGVFDFGIATWYQPVGGASGTAAGLTAPSAVVTSNMYPPQVGVAARATPFVWLSSDGDLQDNRLHRNQALVHKGAEVVMLVEANNYNWIKKSTSTGVHLLNRLAARHGKPTNDGTNAYANFAFFDGHVAPYATQPFDLNYIDTYTTGYSHSTTFFLNKQN